MPCFIPDFPARRDHLLCLRSEAGIVQMFAHSPEGTASSPVLDSQRARNQLGLVPDSPYAFFAQHVWLTVALSRANLLECQALVSSHAVWTEVSHDRRDVYRREQFLLEFFCVCWNTLSVENGKHEREKELSSLSNAAVFFFLPRSCLQLELTLPSLGVTTSSPIFLIFCYLMKEIISFLVTRHSLFILCHVPWRILPYFLSTFFYTAKLKIIGKQENYLPPLFLHYFFLSKI